MDFKTNRSEECGREQHEKDKILDNMKIHMVNMKKKIEKLERIVDRQKQYSRHHCLLMQSIREGERENTDELVLEILNEEVLVDLTLPDLSRTHRSGQKKTLSNKPRAAIIKFVSYNTKKRFFLNKKLLK